MYEDEGIVEPNEPSWPGKASGLPPYSCDDLLEGGEHVIELQHDCPCGGSFIRPLPLPLPVVVSEVTPDGPLEIAQGFASLEGDAIVFRGVLTKHDVREEFAPDPPADA